MYTIEAVGPIKEWSGAHGPMKDYQIKFKEEPEWVTVTQKPETPAPTVGQTLTGTINPTQYGKKFKKEQTFSGGGGSPRQPIDHDSMYKCNALNNAVAMAGDGANEEQVIIRAGVFYAWLKGETKAPDGDPGFSDADLASIPNFDDEV